MLTPIKLKGPLRSKYTIAMVKTAVIPPDRLKKNVGLRKVPQIIEPRITLKRVTVNASRKPRNTSATNEITLANPNLIHGEGKGISASKR